MWNANFDNWETTANWIDVNLDRILDLMENTVQSKTPRITENMQCDSEDIYNLRHHLTIKEISCYKVDGYFQTSDQRAWKINSIHTQHLLTTSQPSAENQAVHPNILLPYMNRSVAQQTHKLNNYHGMPCSVG
jgi:hypothetical protein